MNFWDISADELQVPASRPHHVATRLNERQSKDDLLQHKDEARFRHDALVERRSSRAHHRIRHVLEVQERHFAALEEDRERRSSQLTSALERAEENRRALRENRVQRARQLSRPSISPSSASPATRSAHSASSHHSHHLTREQSARIIQQWYRACRLRRVIKLLTKTRLASQTNFAGLSYEDMSSILHDKKLLRVAQVFFQTLAVSRYGSAEHNAVPFPHRVFLSSFMTVYHPEVILNDHQDELSTSLIEAAQALHARFFAWMAAVQDAAAAQQQPQQQQPQAAVAKRTFSFFINAWHQYLAAFAAWKGDDRQKLIDGMLAQYCELRAMRRSIVIGSGGVSSPASLEWLPHIQVQQNIVRQKLLALGAADLLAQADAGTLPNQAEAEAALDAATLAANADANAAAAEADAARAPSPDDQLQFGDADDRRSATSTPTKSGASSPSRASPTRSSPTRSSASRLPFAAPPRQQQQQSQQQQQPQQADEEVMAARNGLTNAHLAHEIAVDADFSLSDGPTDSVETRFKNVARQAFFDLLHEELTRDPPELRHVPLVIAEIRDGLTSLTMENHARLRTQITEIFDTDLLVQQIERKVFDFEPYKTYILRIAGSLCAPSRDQALADLANIASTAAFCQEALELIRLMRLDLANFHIKAIRPMIKENAVKYEQEKFRQGLAKGILTLDQTKAWLETTVAKVARESTGLLAGTQDAMLIDYYIEAVLRLLEGSPEEALGGASSSSSSANAQQQQQRPQPETWQMDTDRLAKARARLQHMALTAAVHTVVLGFVPSLRDSKEFDRQVTHLCDVLLTATNSDGEKVTLGEQLTAVALQLAQNLRKSHPAAFTEAMATSMQTVIVKLPEGNSVLSVLTRRIFDFLRRRLRANEAQYSVPRRSGLEAVAGQLEKLGLQIAMLSEHNRTVYAEFYDSILRAAIDQQQAAAAAAAAAAAGAQ